MGQRSNIQLLPNQHKRQIIKIWVITIQPVGPINKMIGAGYWSTAVRGNFCASVSFAHQFLKVSFLNLGDGPMNMLGVIQSQKTAELLLDLKVSSIICSPRIASINTAAAISKVQEVAYCLGADCVLRYVEIKQMQDLEVESILQLRKDDAMDASIAPMGWLSRVEDDQIARVRDQAGEAWKSLLCELSDEPGIDDNLVAVAHPAAHVALIGHCLNLKVIGPLNKMVDMGHWSTAVRGNFLCVDFVGEARDK